MLNGSRERHKLGGNRRGERFKTLDPRARDEFRSARNPASILEADARTRTGDPIITSDVLYQLSYVGAGLIVAARKESIPDSYATDEFRSGRPS